MFIMAEEKTNICQRCGDQNSGLAIGDDDFMNITGAIPEIRTFLAKTNYDCLCEKCLHELDGLLQQSAQYNFPTEKNQIIEGVHYYKEKALWVFTELYQMQRGYCCKNGCRHCAYGYKLKN